MSSLQVAVAGQPNPNLQLSSNPNVFADYQQVHLIGKFSFELLWVLVTMAYFYFLLAWAFYLFI